MTTLTKKEMENFASIVAEKINKQVPFEKVIFSAQEAADYLDVSKTYLCQKLQHRVGFPRPIRFEEKRGKPKWFAADLAKWAEGNRV